MQKRGNLAPGAPLFLKASNEVDDSSHRPLASSRCLQLARLCERADDPPLCRSRREPAPHDLPPTRSPPGLRFGQWLPFVVQIDCSSYRPLRSRGVLDYTLAPNPSTSPERGRDLWKLLVQVLAALERVVAKPTLHRRIRPRVVRRAGRQPIRGH